MRLLAVAVLLHTIFVVVLRGMIVRCAGEGGGVVASHWRSPGTLDDLYALSPFIFTAETLAAGRLCAAG